MVRQPCYHGVGSRDLAPDPGLKSDLHHTDLILEPADTIFYGPIALAGIEGTMHHYGGMLSPPLHFRCQCFQRRLLVRFEHDLCMAKVS